MSVAFFLHNDLKKHFSNRTSLFSQLMALRGECFRKHKGRRTYRIELGGKYYFIKQHQGVGWIEIIKNLLQGKKPVLSAKNEMLAIKKCETLPIYPPKVVGYGIRGKNPAQLESFILMEECANTISLETLCATWKKNPPQFNFKKKLIEEVAKIAKQLHENGINHRDFYLCHFLLRNDGKLNLIDLHRAEIRKKVPKRWIMKDLVGLYFSSQGIGLTKKDFYRFIRYYRNQTLKQIFKDESHFFEKVKLRGDKMYHDHAKPVVPRKRAGSST